MSETMETKTETPMGYLDFSLGIAAAWLNNNAAQALSEITDTSDDLRRAVREAQEAVRAAQHEAVEFSKRTVVSLPPAR